jgi:hypothetical protein
LVRHQHAEQQRITDILLDFGHKFDEPERRRLGRPGFDSWLYQKAAWSIAEGAQDYDYIMSHWLYSDILLAYAIKKPESK